MMILRLQTSLPAKSRKALEANGIYCRFPVMFGRSLERGRIGRSLIRRVRRSAWWTRNRTTTARSITG